MIILILNVWSGKELNGLSLEEHHAEQVCAAYGDSRRPVMVMVRDRNGIRWGESEGERSEGG